MTWAYGNEPWALRALGDLELLVLDGEASAWEVAQFVRLAAERDAWLLAPAQFSAWLAGQPAVVREAMAEHERRMGRDLP